MCMTLPSDKIKREILSKLVSYFDLILYFISCNKNSIPQTSPDVPSGFNP
jgi:hypothetical protein